MMLSKKVYLTLFLKAGRADMNERWQDSLFQISEATDENDLGIAIAVFCAETQIDEEEKDRCDRVGTYRLIRAAR